MTKYEGEVKVFSCWIFLFFFDLIILADTDHSHVGKLKKAKYPFGDYAAYADMMKYMRTIEFYYPNITKYLFIFINLNKIEFLGS